jgi:hypothetical protein
MSPGGVTAEVPVEWAVWGKEPGGTKYKILRCSDGALGADDFAAIMTRYAAGTPEYEREVTFSRFGSGPDAHLGVSIQDRTPDVDWVNRPALTARYYAVPFEHLKQVPVSYEGMYEHFAEHRPDGGTFGTSLPALVPGLIAKRVTTHAMRTCALLLTNRRVCVVGAQYVPMIERLRYIDTVAALLPYGMRPQFTASTWTSSTADHKFRLYFARGSRADVYTVDWERESEFPADATGASWYFSLLSRRRSPSELTGIVERLAQATAEMAFDRPDLLAIASIVEGGQKAITPSQEPATPGDARAQQVPQSVGSTLTALADALDRQDGTVLADCVQRLRNADGISDEDRIRHRETIRERGLLARGRPVPAGMETPLYSVLLEIAFGRPPEAADLPLIHQFAGPLHEPLRRVLQDASPSLRLVIGEGLGRDALRAAMEQLSTAELVSLPARWELRPKTVEAICTHLCTHRRGDQLRVALRDHALLAPALEAAFKGNPQQQYEILVTLLQAAYGPRLDAHDVAEIAQVLHWFVPLQGIWQAACALMYGEGAFEVLAEFSVETPVGRSGLSRKIKDEADRLFRAVPDADPVPHPQDLRRTPRLWRWLSRRSPAPPETPRSEESSHSAEPDYDDDGDDFLPTLLTITLLGLFVIIVGVFVLLIYR